MANAFLTAAAIAEEALANLYETTVMYPLVYTDLSREFVTNKQGDTINVRKPAVFQALDFDRTVGIQPQNAVESSIPVKLDKIADVSFVVTDEDMTLKVSQFSQRLLDPAMEAISQKIDRAILAKRSEITQVAGTHAGAAGDASHDPQTWDRPEVLIEAGRILDVNNVPTADRFAVVGPTMKSKWLNTELLKHAEKSGDTAALRQGSIGRDLFGFNTFQTQNVGQPGAPAIGQPTTEVGLAFHRTAFAIATAPMEVPAGVQTGSDISSQNYRGLSLRVAYGWDQKFKQTVVSIDLLYGITLLDPKRAVLLKGADRVA
jgi:hypothetical protein